MHFVRLFFELPSLGAPVKGRPPELSTCSNMLGEPEAFA